MTEDNITLLLEQASSGDEAAFGEVARWAYGELERLASSRLRRRFGAEAITLEPAALVNETFLKLLENPTRFANRRHFFAFASRVMMRVLVDYQRSRGSQKRGGAAVRVTVSGLAAATPRDQVDIVALAECLDRLEQLDARKAEVVKLRTLWGAEMREIADILEISLPTAQRDWRFAKAWLADVLAGPPPERR